MTYVLGIPAPSGKKAEMGTILHKVMEGLAHGKKCLQDDTTSFTDDALGTVSITEQRMADPQFVRWLFEKSFDYYIAKSIHPFDQGDQDDIWKWCCDTLVYGDGWFDPRKRNIVEAEPHFDFTIDEPWARYEYKMPDGTTLEGQLGMKGTIDLLTQHTPDHYEVIDWKSGECKDWGTGDPKTYDDFCVDPQMRVYHWALQKLYPDVKTFTMTVNYVRTEGPFTVAFDQSDMDDTMAMIRKRFEIIQDSTRPKLKSYTNKHWFCKYVCWYGTHKNPENVGCRQTMCQKIAEKVRKNGIEATMVEETEPGFEVGHYQNPGS
jgi:hypothetical protein